MIHALCLVLYFNTNWQLHRLNLKKCFAALAEAREIDLYLRTLEKHFQALEDTDFTECQPLFRPLFHVICMIWRDSKYYCNSSKLMVLLKQICNLLVYQVT